MSKRTVFNVHVQFGDCDPAGIVFFPNFARWMDGASLHFFRQCGVPPWRELVRTSGIVGTPLLETSLKFHRPATYGDGLEVHTWIEAWHRKAFVQMHRVKRGDVLLAEGREVRVFVVRDEADPDRLRAIPVPEDIRARCS